MSTRNAALFVAAVFAFIFAVDYIGDTFGAFWFWCTILAAAYTFVVVANHYSEDEQ